MRKIGLDHITATALASVAKLPEARQRLLVQQFVTQLHQVAKDVQLTHDEWRGAIGYLHRMGARSNDSRSEFSLLSDVTGLSSLVDLLASRPDATPGSVLGPFHTAGAPSRPNPAHLIGMNEGQRVLLRGHLCDSEGRPLGGAGAPARTNA